MATSKKKCCRCKRILSLSNFRKDKTTVGGFARTCKQCLKEDYAIGGKEKYRLYKHNYSINSPASYKKRKLKERLHHKYNLTLGDYDQMVEEQNGVCVICGGINPNGKRLCVDHNHKTGKVRGLLCSRCNTKLGVVEDVSFVCAANLYLKATDS